MRFALVGMPPGRGVVEGGRSCRRRVGGGRRTRRHRAGARSARVSVRRGGPVRRISFVVKWLCRIWVQRQGSVIRFLRTTQSIRSPTGDQRRVHQMTRRGSAGACRLAWCRWVGARWPVDVGVLPVGLYPHTIVAHRPPANVTDGRRSAGRVCGPATEGPVNTSRATATRRAVRPPGAGRFHRSFRPRPKVDAGIRPRTSSRAVPEVRRPASPLPAAVDGRSGSCPQAATVPGIAAPGAAPGRGATSSATSTAGAGGRTAGGVRARRPRRARRWSGQSFLPWQPRVDLLVRDEAMLSCTAP